MITQYSLSVVFPVYNEIECLPDALEVLHDFLAASFADFEVIVVESGSTDGSDRVCDAFAAQRERVVVLHEGARNGAGSALRLGFRTAVKDLVWVVWADLPFPLELVLEAAPLLAHYDAVLSYRARDDRCLYRRFQSVIYNNLAKWILGLRVRHVNSCFKVFRRPVVQSLNLISRAWGIEAELAFRLERSGATYAEIPVPLVDRTVGTSSVTVMTPLEEFAEVLKLAFRERLVPALTGKRAGASLPPASPARK